MRLDGKVALITGGAKGQGREEAKLFAKEGAKVVLGDILDNLGQEAAKDIQDTGREATYVHLDVTNETDWKSSIEIVLQKYGRLDILVNNAGILIRKGIEDTTSEDWTRIMDINVKGAFLGIRAAIPVMRQVDPLVTPLPKVQSDYLQNPLLFNMPKRTLDAIQFIPDQ